MILPSTALVIAPPSTTSSSSTSLIIASALPLHLHLPLMFSFLLIVRKLHLLVAHFLVVEIRCIAAFHSFERLREDEGRVLGNVEDLRPRS